jgi:hypothetical protein
LASDDRSSSQNRQKAQIVRLLGPTMQRYVVGKL